jgi:hypothetical protein
LDTSITIWVPFGVAQLFGAMKESPHSRVFVSPYSFDCGIMQPMNTLASSLEQSPRREIALPISGARILLAGKGDSSAAGRRHDACVNRHECSRRYGASAGDVT